MILFLIIFIKTEKNAKINHKIQGLRFGKIP